MNKRANNVGEFPGSMTSKLPSEDVPSTTVVILTSVEKDEAIVKYVLGDLCQLVICSSPQALSRLVRRSGDTPANLVLIRDQLLEDDCRIIRDVVKRLPPLTPVLALGDKTDMRQAGKYMRSGIRDAVSLDDSERFRAVVARELSDYRIRCAYDPAAAFAAHNEQQAGSSPVGLPAAAKGLMQIHNREHFVELITGRVVRKPARGVRALVWIRPDNFSSIQDSVGVLASEDVLTHIGSVLRDLLHPADICGRFGGTIFTVLVERGTMVDIEAWAQQFCRRLSERPFVRMQKEIQLSCCVGICAFANSDDPLERVLHDAHNACSRGRIQGDGQICLSESSKSTRSTHLRDKKWGNRIRSALRNDLFQLGHSPVARLDGNDEKIRDTWVRMIDQKGQLILATEFLPVAKRLGLMVHIDRWVIAATLNYCSKRKPDLVFVRLSKNSMLDDTLGQWLQKLFAVSRVKPSQICFQTTAPVAVRHMKQTIRQITQLAALGFRFSIDQVGATSEMMDVLQLVPMQFARIDSALLQQVAWDKSVQHKVTSIINACRTRGIHTIAERVEDAATMAVLCQMGVEFMQGDYLRRDSIVMEDTVTICTPQLPPGNIA